MKRGLLLIFGITVLIWAVLYLMPSPSPKAATPVEEPSLITVMCVEGQDNPDCEDYVRDLSRRTRLTEAEQQAGEAARLRIEAALPRGEVRCRPVEIGLCAKETSQPGVDAVREALTEAGFSGSIVRLARFKDPAPAGRVMLAVPVGRACVLAYADGTSPHAWVVGALPNGGGCLTL
ncbi:hypothetical protein OHA21_09420 [Actinoplanes sp. NBC_00393]|uniref:hypothetical protein n=1 Tax=Actinoplanes sp. NBC_00393 TaxID=2975953 RepID=UPI002E24E86B